MGDFMGKLLLKQDEMILLKNSEALNCNPRFHTRYLG